MYFFISYKIPSKLIPISILALHVTTIIILGVDARLSLANILGIYPCSLKCIYSFHSIIIEVSNPHTPFSLKMIHIHYLMHFHEYEIINLFTRRHVNPSMKPRQSIINQTIFLILGDSIYLIFQFWIYFSITFIVFFYNLLYFL